MKYKKAVEIDFQLENFQKTSQEREKEIRNVYQDLTVLKSLVDTHQEKSTAARHQMTSTESNTYVVNFLF